MCSLFWVVCHIFLFSHLAGHTSIKTFLYWINFYAWIYYILFIYSSVDVRLGCFHFFAIMNMLLWIFVCKFLSGHMFSFFLGVIPRNGIVRLYYNFMFNFWRSYFPKQLRHCIVHHPYVVVTISPYPCQHLLSFILAILSGFEVIFHCDFDFHFSNDYWCWVSFQMLIGLLLISFAVAVCGMCVYAYTHMHIHTDSLALIAEVVWFMITHVLLMSVHESFPPLSVPGRALLLSSCNLLLIFLTLWLLCTPISLLAFDIRKYCMNWGLHLHLEVTLCKYSYSYLFKLIFQNIYMYTHTLICSKSYNKSDMW